MLVIHTSHSSAILYEKWSKEIFRDLCFLPSICQTLQRDSIQCPCLNAHIICSFKAEGHNITQNASSVGASATDVWWLWLKLISSWGLSLLYELPCCLIFCKQSCKLPWLWVNSSLQFMMDLFNKHETVEYVFSNSV